MNNRVFAAALCALALPLFADEKPVDKGTLCFMNAKQAANCSATEGDVVHVDAADTERAYVWSSADGRIVRAALLAPKATDINVADDSLRVITLSLRGDRKAMWPADLRVLAADASKKQWAWTIPAKSVESLTQIQMPAGKYVFAFAADHYLTDRRRVDLVKTIAMKEVTLRPMPAVAGRVVTTKDEPISNAQILRGDRKPIGTTNEQGNFRAEAGEPLPDSVWIEKPGFGARLIPVQLATASADVGLVRLGTALKLTVRLVQRDNAREPLKVGLQRVNEFRYGTTTVTYKELGANDPPVVFGDLSKGKYYVIAEGPSVTEKLMTKVELDDKDVEKEIRIEPFHLDGTARLGDDPLTGKLEISSHFVDGEYLNGVRYTIPVENGTFGGTFWQRGKLSGYFQMAAFGEPVSSPDIGDDPSTWDIRFPKRFISGRVYDADTQQPVSGATMEHLITWSGESGRFYGSIKIHDDGSYSVLATRLGTYELKVSAPDHVADKQTIEIHQDDGSVQRDFALTKGIAATIEFLWPSGAPVVNGAVMEGVASDGYNAERHYMLDASGHVSLQMRPGESRTLYIVPRDGSFGIAHVVADENSETKPVRVIVPLPAGTLNMHIVGSDGKAASTRIAMLYNGEPVPQPVLGLIGQRPSPGVVDTRHLVQMPAGAYELWPIEARTFVPIGPPKSVGLSSGDVDVELVATTKTTP